MKKYRRVTECAEGGGERSEGSGGGHDKGEKKGRLIDSRYKSKLMVAARDDYFPASNVSRCVTGGSGAVACPLTER